MHPKFMGFLSFDAGMRNRPESFTRPTGGPVDLRSGLDDAVPVTDVEGAELDDAVMRPGDLGLVERVELHAGPAAFPAETAEQVTRDIAPAHLQVRALDVRRFFLEGLRLPPSQTFSVRSVTVRPASRAAARARSARVR